MGEEIALENGSNFRLSRAHNLDLDLGRVMLHTVMHHSSTSTYLPNFIEIGRKILFEKHNCCYCQLQNHVTQKLGQKLKKNRPNKL